MALFKYARELANAQDGRFDRVFPAGRPVLFTGIYRCLGCGREDVGKAGETIRPNEAHNHPDPISWHLLVCAEATASQWKAQNTFHRVLEEIAELAFPERELVTG